MRKAKKHGQRAYPCFTTRMQSILFQKNCFHQLHITIIKTVELPVVYQSSTRVLL